MTCSLAPSAEQTAMSHCIPVSTPEPLLVLNRTVYMRNVHEAAAGPGTSYFGHASCTH